jgi:hypothetical protein
MFDIHKYQKELEQLCQQYNVQELAIFGSALREDFDPERSDIDLAVTFKPMEPRQHAQSYFALIEALEALFGRKVDLLSPKAIRNPYMKRNLEKTQERVYVASG